MIKIMPIFLRLLNRRLAPRGVGQNGTVKEGTSRDTLLGHTVRHDDVAVHAVGFCGNGISRELFAMVMEWKVLYC